MWTITTVKLINSDYTCTYREVQLNFFNSPSVRRFRPFCRVNVSTISTGCQRKATAFNLFQNRRLYFAKHYVRTVAVQQMSTTKSWHNSWMINLRFLTFWHLLRHCVGAANNSAIIAIMIISRPAEDAQVSWDRSNELMLHAGGLRTSTPMIDAAMPMAMRADFTSRSSTALKQFCTKSQHAATVSHQQRTASVSQWLIINKSPF